jgi:hypothetical protein
MKDFPGVWPFGLQVTGIDLVKLRIDNQGCFKDNYFNSVNFSREFGRSHKFSLLPGRLTRRVKTNYGREIPQIAGGKRREGEKNLIMIKAYVQVSNISPGEVQVLKNSSRDTSWEQGIV